MGDRLVHLTGDNYDLHLKDGGRVEFRTSSHGHPAQAIVDPYGQRTILTYDTSGRLSTITEPAGRFLQLYYTTFHYVAAMNPPVDVYIDFLTKVEAWDGRGNLIEKVLYHYEEVHPPSPFSITFWNLTTATYDDGNTAVYEYYDPIEALPGNHLSKVPGRVKTCNDVRCDAAMKHIMYEYVTVTNGGCINAVGQILSEKNVNGQALSTVEYPQAGLCLPAFSPRTERRPDGATRLINYDGGEIQSYTDFAKLTLGEIYHTTTITYQNDVTPDGQYARIVTDAYGHPTKTFKDPNNGAVMALVHADNSTVEYHYQDSADPHYVSASKDENDHWTAFTRNSQTHQVERIDYPDGGFETFTYDDNPFGLVHEHRMTSGGTEIFEYDTRGLKTTYSDPTPDHHQTHYFYYTSAPHIDRLWYMVDPRGNATWYEYNQRGLVTKVTHQDGKFIQSEYYTDGTLQWTEDELHHRTTYTRDEYKRVTEVKNHLNETVTNSYAPWNINDPQGRSHTTSSIYLTTSFMGRQIKYDYDTNFRRLLTTQAPGDPNDEATTNFTYDWVGNLIRVEDPRHKFTTYGYDHRNRQTSIWNEELNETTTVIYNPAGDNKAKETRQDGAFRTWDYDTMNRLWHAYDWRTSDPATPNQTTTYDRDHAGNPHFVTDTKGKIYTFEYDEINRKKSATYPGDNTLPVRTETWLYDIAGNLDQYKNPAGQVRYFHYDSRNRQDHSYWLPAGVGQDIVTGYDDASRVTSITTNNGETIVGFGYDDANRKIWEDQKLAGQPTRRVKTDLDHDGKRLNLQIVDPPVDGAGLVFSPEMSGSGSYSIAYAYTGRNQLWQITGAAGENWMFTYSYDASGNMISRRADYNNRSSLTSCPNDDYDALNRPRTWEQSGPNGFYASNHYQYDQVNREKSIWRSEDNHRGESFEYEVTNQLKQVSYNTNIGPTPPPPTATPPNATPTPPNGTPTPPNGTPTPPPNATPTPAQHVAMPTFNPAGRNYFPLNSMPITIATTTTGAQIIWTNDGSDPAPNNGTVIPASSGTISTGYRESFTLKAIAFKPGLVDSAIHEDAYSWDSGDSPSSGGRTVTYTYTPDKLNRSSMNDSGTVTSYSPNALNQYTSVGGTSVSYDDNFNLAHTIGYNGIYDAANRLVSASNGGSGQAQQTVAGFVYDGLGRCVKRTMNGVATVFVYDGWKPIGEFDEWGFFQAWNVYGPGADEILLRQQDKYGYVRFLSDRHGNVAFLLDNDANLIEKYTYDVFGQPKITDATGTVVRAYSYYSHDFLFQGREYIRELGLYDYRHRFYHPGLGSFIQTDPIGLQTEGAKFSAEQTALYGDGAPAAFTSSELNLYRYCNSDPVDTSDPFGLVPPGEGLMDLSRKTAQEIKEAMKDNIKNTETKPAYDPNGHPVKQEFRTTNYKNGSKEQPASTPGGYHPPGSKPTAPLPPNPFGKGNGRPTWDSHSHISGSGKPYAPGDINAANYLRVPLGVQSATGGPLYIYVPSATLGERGGLFRLEGNRLINDATGREAPH